MSQLRVYKKQVWQRMLKDQECQSGYNYAKQAKIWREHTAEDLESLAGAFFFIYCQEENKNSFGMAVYLQELVDSKLGNRKKH